MIRRAAGERHVLTGASYIYIFIIVATVRYSYVFMLYYRTELPSLTLVVFRYIQYYLVRYYTVVATADTVLVVRVLSLLRFKSSW